MNDPRPEFSPETREIVRAWLIKKQGTDTVTDEKLDECLRSLCLFLDLIFPGDE